MKHPRPHLAGALISLLGFTLWVLTDACAKLSTESGLAPIEVGLFMSFVGAATIALKALVQKRVRRLRPHDVKFQLLSGLACLVAFVCCITALKHLPFIIFYIAVFTTPMVTTIFAAIFLREKLSGGNIAAILIGFLGVIVANDPFGKHDLQGDWIGYAMIALNVVAFAALMIIQRGYMQKEPWESVAFIQALVQVFVFGVGTVFDFRMPSPSIILIMLVGGLLSIAGNTCNILATKKTTTTTVVQFHYTQIISGALIGFFLWHEVPTRMLLLGSVLIIASGLYIANHSRKADKAELIKPL